MVPAQHLSRTLNSSPSASEQRKHPDQRPVSRDDPRRTCPSPATGTTGSGHAAARTPRSTSSSPPRSTPAAGGVRSATRSPGGVLAYRPGAPRTAATIRRGRRAASGQAGRRRQRHDGRGTRRTTTPQTASGSPSPLTDPHRPREAAPPAHSAPISAAAATRRTCRHPPAKPIPTQSISNRERRRNRADRAHTPGPCSVISRSPSSAPETCLRSRRPRRHG